VLVVALVACFSGVSAVGAPAQPEAPAVAAEPGWPLSHQPESDPQPGEPGYEQATLSPVPTEGMTDAELKKKDPRGYALVMKDRRVIEDELLKKVRGALSERGVKVGDSATLSATDAQTTAVALASTPYSPWGYLKFTLVPSTSSYARSGYLGTLYFTYGIYNATVDSYKWFTTSWPARSGNNKPADQSRVGVGPIPAYKWTFAFMNGAWRGYEADTRAEFSPGKWRLDPWTGGPYSRSYLEVHGGTGTHEYGPTAGCIRLYSSHIPGLKSYYDYKMANKKDPATAKLTVTY
jgi:hypothetical protein